MIQLDNLASMLLQELSDKLSEQDFGNVFQDLVTHALAAKRPGLAAQGNAGNPDLTWQGWGWEIKTGPRSCPISKACLAAMGNYAHQRLVFLDTTSTPFPLHVCDFTPFVQTNVGNGQESTACTPGHLGTAVQYEETELCDGLGNLLRAVNTALVANIPPNNVRAALAARIP